MFRYFTLSDQWEEDEVQVTLRSIMDEGKLNSSTMQTGIAPPHGFALSIFLSKRTHSILGFLARASAAHAPEGPPPTTATLYFCPAAVVSYSGRICVSDECTGTVLGIMSRKNFLLTKGAGGASSGEEYERGEHCWLNCNVVVRKVCIQTVVLY